MQIKTYSGHLLWHLDETNQAKLPFKIYNGNFEIN